MREFLQVRWRGEVPLETVFLRDMLLIGSAINVALSIAAWGLLRAGWPDWLALVLHLLPVPWNIFLICAVWRSANADTGSVATVAKTIAVMWLMTMFVL